MFRIALERFHYTWKQGLILILTLVLCAFGFITIIRPLKVLKEQIDADKTRETQGYYCFKINGFDCSNLDSLEKELSGNGTEYMVACQKEFDVEYLNFKGHGNAITITDLWLNKLEKSYGEESFQYYELLTGRIPNSKTEVLMLDFAYSDWEFDANADTKIEKSAVLPEIGECQTTGLVTSNGSLMFPLELSSGFIVNKDAFKLISNTDTVTVFVFADRSLSEPEETKLKNIISEYAEVEEASFSETIIDTSGDEASLTLASELSFLLIVAIVLCEITVTSDYIKSNIGFINICGQLGLSKLGCCLLSQMPVVILLVLSDFFVFAILKFAEKSDALSFMNIGCPYDILILLSQPIIVLISAGFIYFRLKGKECQ